MPESTLEQQQCFDHLQRVSASPENAAAILETSHQLDVTSLAATVQVPTLVLHARGDAHVPFEEGKHLATLVPSARFAPLDSRNHMLLQSEPAWVQFLTEVRAFLADGADPRSTPRLASVTQLTRAELQVLALLGRGIDNAAIASQLGKGEKTVRNQVSSILGKLRVRTRAEAVALARDAGIGEPSS